MALSRSRTKMLDRLIRVYIAGFLLGDWWVSTRSILVSDRSLRFSKTAGSRPLHDEAGGEGDGLMTRAVVGRRHADDVVKGPAECAQAGEAGVATDVGSPLLGLAQHEHGPLEPPAVEVG